jgi:uncharacterized protein (UPF0276 family)
VIDEVWRLYERACRLSGGRSTLLEWDENIPEFEVVHAEVLKARNYFAQGQGSAPDVSKAGGERVVRVG